MCPPTLFFLSKIIWAILVYLQGYTNFWVCLPSFIKQTSGTLIGCKVWLCSSNAHGLEACLQGGSVQWGPLRGATVQWVVIRPQGLHLNGWTHAGLVEQTGLQYSLAQAAISEATLQVWCLLKWPVSVLPPSHLVKPSDHFTRMPGHTL